MKIIGIDETMSSSNPNMGERYFELDNLPSRDWSQMFQRVHDQNFDMMKRKTRVYNSWIIVDCPFGEMQHQINYLNDICKKVSDAIQAAQLRAEQEEARRQAIEEEMQKKAREHFNTLKFDKNE